MQGLTPYFDACLTGRKGLNTQTFAKKQEIPESVFISPGYKNKWLHAHSFSLASPSPGPSGTPEWSCGKIQVVCLLVYYCNCNCNCTIPVVSQKLVANSEYLGWISGKGSSPEGGGHGTVFPGQWLWLWTCWSSRNIWTTLSDLNSDVLAVLCGARSWSWWSLWVSSHLGYSMILCSVQCLLGYCNK